MIVRKFIVNIALFIRVVAAIDIDIDTNQCSWIKGCRCTNSLNILAKGRLGASCYRVKDPELHLLASVDIWSIRVVGCRFSDASLLRKLNDTRASRVFLIENEFLKEDIYFDWQWIPETARNVSIIGNRFHGLRDGAKTGRDCNITRYDGDVYLSMSNEKFSGIPTCIPKTTHILSLTRLHGGNREEEIIWPPKLSILRLSQMTFGNYSENIFKNTPPTLHTIWANIGGQVNTSWLNNLPTDSLQTLIITYGQLTHLPTQQLKEFDKWQNLRHLHIRHNNLTDIPDDLPSTLKVLRLNYNNIKFITSSRWSTMINLEVLDLSFNKLRSVPLKMPASLLKIELQSNMISYSEPTAFIHIKNLSYLNLESNKLMSLPRGIQPGINTYNVGKNQISHVRDSSEYDFCVNGTQMSVHGNPWQCDLKMLTMIQWLTNHGAVISRFNIRSRDQSMKTRCQPTDLSGITAKDGRSNFEIALDFMSYFQQPPNQGCSYNLKVLTCQDARLQAVPDRIPPGLLKIAIKDNKNLVKIPDYKFADQKRLTSLDLNNNSLLHIPNGLPNTLQQLELSNNQIGEWSDEDLESLLNLTALTYLNLEDNNIKVMYSWQFNGLDSLTWIGLGGNQLHCDCSLGSFANYFSRLVPWNPLLIARNYPVCDSPMKFKGRVIHTMAGYYRYSDCTPTKCRADKMEVVLNCSKAVQTDRNHIFYVEGSYRPGTEVKLKGNSAWRTLDLTGLGLESRHINYVNLTELRSIDLSDNSIEEMPINGLPPKIRIINLTRNAIMSLPSHKTISAHFPELHSLDLTYNKIKIIGKEVSLLEVIPMVFLEGNPLKCECSSRSLIDWMHAIKEERELIERNRLQSLTCTTADNSKAYKVMDIKEEQYCRELPIIGIISGVVFGVFLSLAGIFLLNFYSQKKRERKIKDQILLGFQGLLEKEQESDPETGIGTEKDYKFDAFVSYDPNSGEDAEFVISLLEELEDKRGYALCLNERDFIPGAGITDNIVECIGASKHIILILSQSFASSPWCHYEVQVALTELHHRRKSQFIISVLLQDSAYDEEDMSTSNNMFLSLVSTIHAPKVDRSDGKAWMGFWKQLVNMMPMTPISRVN